MKKGYTLAEVMITLGIIGIVSALIMPLANKMRPNENKVKYLQTYDAISKVVKDLANDSSVYPAVRTLMIDGNSETVDYMNAPFYNVFDNNSIQHNNKLGGLIAERFNTQDNVDIDSIQGDQSTAWSDNDTVEANIANDTFVPTFTTANGVDVFITTHYVAPTTVVENNTNAEYMTDVYFDVNGHDRGNNCMFDANNCTNPDIFRLTILGDGSIIPTDLRGAGYLNTRTNLFESDALGVAGENDVSGGKWSEVPLRTVQ